MAHYLAINRLLCTGTNSCENTYTECNSSYGRFDTTHNHIRKYLLLLQLKNRWTPLPYDIKAALMFAS